MYYRYMYACYLEEGKGRLLPCPVAENASVSYFRGMAFLYFETEEENLSPACVLEGEIKPLPDGTRFVPMQDVFHYSKPRTKEGWKRSLPDKAPWVRINRLRPNMLARYLYFHYQYQEERPGGGPDKYGVIFLYGDYIVHYLEWPFEAEKDPPKGALTTNATPADDVDIWDSIMSEFFVPWDDTEFEWHAMLTVTPDGKEHRIPANIDKL